jgi:twitching motility protein PilI
MPRTSKLDLRAFQQELARRLASKTSAQVESSRLGLAFGGENWLVKLPDAGEVIPLPLIATVPLTRSWFLGIANIRGNLYSVVDFAAFMGRGATALTRGSGSQARLVLFGERSGDWRVGVVVSRVIGLRNIADLEPAVSLAEVPAWYGPRWMDAEGVAWQEIDLGRLAHDPVFLQVGE